MHATTPSVAASPTGGVLAGWVDRPGSDHTIAVRYRPPGGVMAFEPRESTPDLDGSALGGEFFAGPSLAFGQVGMLAGRGRATLIATGRRARRGR